MDNIISVSGEQSGDVLIVRVKGKLDSLSSSVLEEQVFQLLQNGQSKLLLDLGEVRYINSAGLRTLLSIRKHLKTLSGKCIVCCLRSELLDIVRICGFEQILDLANTVEEGTRML